MKILHTSDWHLGRTLYGKKRYDEFAAFLDWLLGVLETGQIDVLLVAGDVFDTTTPSNRAQTLYYQFLSRVAATACRHVVIVGGNHDSPTFLDAPKALLGALNVHVVGSITDRIQDELLAFRDQDGAVELLVGAVPYLRDRDIRVAEAGESSDDKERKLLEGVRRHYAEVAVALEALQAEADVDVPVVAMGHLFAAGGQIVDGDGVRDLYVGSLAHVHASVFPPGFNYVALGHLHVPQKVGGTDHIRYSGSPLPMGFGEAYQQKSVCLVRFEGRTPEVSLLPVPVFQPLERLAGDWAAISDRLQALVESAVTVWVEVVYQGDEVMGDLRERIEQLVNGSSVEVLRIKNKRLAERVLEQQAVDEALEDLDARAVFERCLEAHEVPAHQRADLRAVYAEILVRLHEDDARA